MSDALVEWLRGVLEADKAAAEADYEWQIVKAKGGHNEKITRADAELAILDKAWHSTYAPEEEFSAEVALAEDVIRLLASGYQHRDGYPGDEESRIAPRRVSTRTRTQ